MLNYDLNEIVKCKYCGQKEYWGKMVWLDSKELCRNCYHQAIEHKGYKYPDIERIELCR